MIFGQTLAVAFGMFSALPVPQPEWNKKNMKYALLAFPLVGLVIGLLWWGWAVLADRFAIPDLLRAVVLCLVPAAVTGGIHLDGYADTADALASHQGPARAREILKDPHLGTFAVIRLIAFFLLYTALCAVVSLDGRTLLCAGASFLLSRTLSGLSVSTFPLSASSGLAHTFAEAADKKTVRAVLLVYAVLLTALMIVAGRWEGGAMVLAAVLVYLRYASMSKKRFGGLSGDLAGWFLQTCELWMLAALAAVQLVEARI